MELKQVNSISTNLTLTPTMMDYLLAQRSGVGELIHLIAILTVTDFQMVLKFNKILIHSIQPATRSFHLLTYGRLTLSAILKMYLYLVRQCTLPLRVLAVKRSLFTW